MAFNIVAYTGFSKKINSTAQPSGGTTLTVSLKEPTSVLSPVFLVTGFNTAHNYVSWGSRYYFIDDIVLVTANLAEYHCSTDVLATYKNDIGASSQYVLRSASTFDGTVSDSFYPMKAQKGYGRTSHANGFIFPQAGAYILGVQGLTSGETFGSTTYYVLDVYQAGSLMDEVFNIQNTEYDATAVESASGIPEKVYMSLINPQQYIVSCMFIPYDVESIGGAASTPIKIGWYDLGVSGRIFNPSYSALPVITNTFTLSKHPQNARGVYMNNAPFTEYVLSYMPFGEIPLPADMLLNETQIFTKIIIDVITGQGTLKIYAGASDQGQLLESRSAQIGVPIAVSGGVYDTSIGGNVSKAIKGSLAGAALGALAGKNFFSSVTDGISEAATTPSISTSGSNGALDFLEYDAILYSHFTYVTDDDNTQHGRPLCQVKTINTLSGFIMCLKPDLATAASTAEKNAIIEYLGSGFFYE